ncbi:MAG: hypothetical protein AAF518_01345 [Spirochaetota bacterium]
MVEDFDSKGLFDRLTICIDKLNKPDDKCSPRRRMRYRNLAQEIIKALRWEFED